MWPWRLWSVSSPLHPGHGCDVPPRNTSKLATANQTPHLNNLRIPIEFTNNWANHQITYSDRVRLHYTSIILKVRIIQQSPHLNRFHISTDYGNPHLNWFHISTDYVFQPSPTPLYINNSKGPNHSIPHVKHALWIWPQVKRNPQQISSHHRLQWSFMRNWNNNCFNMIGMQL